jgi:anthranilate/para-aminobenzoate synthase component I
VESYATVHQLVSTVEGQLEPGRSPVDAVIACFPAGSMTGTPKSSATRILDRLEGHARGIYSGAFGYFGLDGRIDLAMTIRTIILSPAGASIGTGGGITALSDPADELAEIKLKASALLDVLGAQ